MRLSGTCLRAFAALPDWLSPAYAARAFSCCLSVPVRAVIGDRCFYLNLTRVCMLGRRVQVSLIIYQLAQLDYFKGVLSSNYEHQRNRASSWFRPVHCYYHQAVHPCPAATTSTSAALLPPGPLLLQPACASATTSTRLPPGPLLLQPGCTSATTSTTAALLPPGPLLLLPGCTSATTSTTAALLPPGLYSLLPPGCTAATSTWLYSLLPPGCTAATTRNLPCLD